MKSVLVYCGSSSGTNPIYAEMAEMLGVELVKRKMKLIYGGGSVGLMGVIADSVMENGGEVIGVIPSFLDAMEVGHPSLTETHVVESMHERKAKMETLADGIITLPGGFGSMDELFEIVTWSQLGLHKKPIGILNVNGYYNALIQQLDIMVKEGFLKQSNRDILIIDDSIENLFKKMEEFIPNKNHKWLDRKKT
jgi:uncharacterized protein (TIGR00730 family)